MMVMQKTHHRDWSPLSNCISRILRGHVSGARLLKEKNKRKKQFHTVPEINCLLFALQHLTEDYNLLPSQFLNDFNW